MTRRATSENVKGDFVNVDLELDGNRYTLGVENGIYWVELDIIGVGAPDRRVRSRHRVELVTGSHHMQVYWYSTGELRELARIPFSYIIGEGWVPYRATFMQPPETLPEVCSTAELVKVCNQLEQEVTGGWIGKAWARN